MASIYQIAEIPIGLKGLNGNANQSQIPIDALITAENVTFESGTVQKEGGTAEYTTSGVGADAATPSDVSIIAGTEWNHDGSTQRIVIVTSDGSILRDDGSGAFTTTLASGLTVSGEYPVFVEGGKEAAANNRKLICFTGLNSPQVLSGNGASTSAVTTPPADWSGSNQPRWGFSHEGRIFAGGNTNDPHRVYYSTASDHENWTGEGAGSLNIYPGDGEKLVGGVSFKGAAILFKSPRGIYLVDTSDVFPNAWSVDKINGNIGCVGVRAFNQVENDVILVDQNIDIRFVSSIEAFGNIGTDSLSDKSDMAEFFRNNLNFAQKGRWTAVYHAHKRQIHIAVTRSGSSVNDARIVIDFNTPGVAKFSWSTLLTTESLWVRNAAGIPELMAGNDNGQVFRLDQTTRSHESAGYGFEIQTPYMDLSHVHSALSTVRKNAKYLELVVEPTGNFDVNADIYWDGNLKETVTFNTGSDAATLGNFIIGTDKLGGSQILNRKRRLKSGGRRISIGFRNSGNGENVSLSKAILHFTVDGDRPGTGGE